MGLHDSLPPKIPPYSKLQDLASSVGNSDAPYLSRGGTGSGLGPRQVSSLGVEGSQGNTSPLLHPRLIGMHRSMESLPLQMSLAREPRDSDREDLIRGYTAIESRSKDRQVDMDSPSSWSSGSKASLSVIDRWDLIFLRKKYKYFFRKEKKKDLILCKQQFVLLRWYIPPPTGHFRNCQMSVMDEAFHFYLHCCPSAAEPDLFDY